MRKSKEDTGVLRGAYVQAWVWVDVEEISARAAVKAATLEEHFRALADVIWGREGEIEIDDDAKVSLSYDRHLVEEDA